MKKIVTLTLNPAVDKSSSIQRVLAEHKLRCDQPNFEPGGGGINVSRAIKKLGGESVAVFPKGGPTGELLEMLLNKEGITIDSVELKEWTRENFIVVEKETNHQYRFGMPGPSLDENEWKTCLDKVTNSCKGVDYLVASGSMPKGVPVDFYAKLAREASKNNVRFILDSSGEALQAAVKEKIFLLKPNLNELGILVGSKLDHVHEQEDAAMEVIHRGNIEVLCVSLGPAGALLASKDGILHVSAPSIKKKSTVGAGDSMVAGIVYSLSQGKSQLEAIRYGVACGTAATMNSGTELCKKEDVERLYNWIVTNSQR